MIFLRCSACALLISLAATATSCAGQSPGASSPDDASVVLPLKTVRLYEGGVGYFERAGTLQAGASARLPVPASHVDDALKSVLVLGSGASVTSLEFATLLSGGRARSLAGLPLEADHPITFGEVLASFKGTRIAAQLAEETVRGTLLEVQELIPEAQPAPAADDESGEEKAQEKTKEAEPNPFALAILTDEGALRRLNTRDVIDIAPLDESVTRRLGVAALALSERSAQLERALDIVAKSSQPIRIGYVAETPVWRTTYRLVLAQGSRARLQGWALIHNDTDERWDNVHIALVNGLPDSYLHPLSAPRYEERPLAEPERKLSTVPQLAHRTADGIWGDHIPRADGEEESYGLYGTGSGGGGRGEGIGLGSIGTLGYGAGTRYGSSDQITLGDLAALNPATGEEQAALFSYTLPENINLRPHGSALLPFLESEVKVETMTWFSGGGTGRSAAVLHNLGQQTLPGGMMTFFQAEGFVGEGALPRLKPGEHAFIEYGTDLDVEIERRVQKTSEETLAVSVTEGDLLQRHFVLTTDEQLKLKNRSASARTVQLGLHLGANSKVLGADRLAFDQARGGAVAIFETKARSQREVALQTAVARVAETELKAVSAQQLEELVNGPTLPSATKDTLRAALALMAPVETTRKTLTRLNEERRVLSEQQEQWYEHERKLSADKDDHDDPIAARIVQLQDRITELDAKIRLAEAQLAEELNTVREKLSPLRKEDSPQEEAVETKTK
jgi:hypothetical protein